MTEKNLVGFRPTRRTKSRRKLTKANQRGESALGRKVSLIRGEGGNASQRAAEGPVVLA